MNRERPSLRSPRNGEDLESFPVTAAGPRRPYWRLTREGHVPWWFGSSLAGRFDLYRPNGTCYLASDDLGAILETLGPGLLSGGLAPDSLLTGRHLQRLRLPRRLRVANCRAARASRWLTAEISTLTPYQVPQAWAREFHRAGFDGIRYAPRHSTSPRVHALALFGPSGERNDWPKGQVVTIGSACRRRLRDRCGITLFSTPYADELVFAKFP